MHCRKPSEPESRAYRPRPADGTEISMPQYQLIRKQPNHFYGTAS